MQALKIPPPNLLHYPSLHARHWMANNNISQPTSNNDKSHTKNTATNNNNTNGNNSNKTTTIKNNNGSIQATQSGDGRQQQQQFRKAFSTANRQNQNFSLGSTGRSKWANNKPTAYGSTFTAIPSLDKLRNEFLSGDMSKRISKPAIERRATVRNNSSTYEIIVDIADYDQSEIDIKVGHGIVIVSGCHNSSRGSSPTRISTNRISSQSYKPNSEKNTGNNKKSEMRSFSERYTLPPSVDPDTLKWSFSGNRLLISSHKNGAPGFSIHNLNNKINYRNQSLHGLRRQNTQVEEQIEELND